MKLETILHDLFALGITAAALFVKNPAHQTQAASLVALTQQLLPLADSLLNPAAVAAAAA
jgi:hypothetical protein